MHAFSCDRCGQLLFFENSVCLRCGTNVGFLPSAMELVSSEGLQLCSNRQVAECNWIVEAPGDSLCRSCSLTRMRPEDADVTGLDQFANAEAAKRRLIFQLLDLGLPLEQNLAFALLSSATQPVTTGHDEGLITIDLAESDDARREARRQQLAEPYRTMLGHFRHEIGHYYEPILVDRAGYYDAAQAMFGDSSIDYGAALERHYNEGPAADWAERHVSAYATMHPWEDWAETFAHYLHIRDTLQTSAAFGIYVAGPRELLGRYESTPEIQADGSFSELLADWLPLTYALNQVNRSMGRGDLYPFTLAPAVIEKLTFVHDRVKAVAA